MRPRLAFGSLAGLLALVLPLTLVKPAAATGVKLAMGVAGRKIIVNESTDQRARRLSTRLLPAPESSLEPLIDRHAEGQQLDPRLVRAVIQVESGFNVLALSRVGAKGLMQLMPGTANDLFVSDPYDADQNVRGGTAYLRRMIDRFGSVELALAAYNAGPDAVSRHGGIPPYRETRDYVRRILALYRGDDSLALPAGALAVPLRKTHLVRGPNGRLLVTTALSAAK